MKNTTMQLVLGCNFLKKVCVIIAIAGLGSTTHATVLSFSTASGAFAGNQSVVYKPQSLDPLLPVYGDHVASTLFGTPSYPFAYFYGNNGEGLTPKIGVSYSPGSPTSATSAGNPFPVWLNTGFGDLSGVIYQLDQANTAANLTLGITFTADPGYWVKLQGFQLAAYNWPGTNVLGQLSVVVDGVTNSLGSNLYISKTGHNTYDFSATPYVGSQVTIFMDGRDLTYFGGNTALGVQSFTDIAIDNIVFSQVAIPEPSTVMLIGVGGMLSWRLKTKKGKQSMKNTNMRPVRGSSRLKRLCAIMTFAALSAVMLPEAQASVITLTGGDAGEGYAPLEVSKYAYHFTHTNLSQATNTIQGVSFLPFNTVVGGGTIGNVSIVNANPYPAVGTPIGGSANDLALQGLGSAIVYGQTKVMPGAMTLTLSGLVSGSNYQLDLFWFYQSGTVPATYTITDATGQKFDTVPGVGGAYYDVREQVIANGLGQVSILVTNFVAAPDAPYLNAFSLTAYAPEPSTVMLLGVGGMLVAIRRRARTS